MAELAALEPGVGDTAHARLAARREARNGNGAGAATREAASQRPQDDSRPSAPVETPPSGAGPQGAPDPVRSCRHCAGPLPADVDTRAVYCSSKCRRAAKSAREAAAQREARASARASRTGGGDQLVTAAGAGHAEPAAPEIANGLGDLGVELDQPAANDADAARAASGPANDARVARATRGQADAPEVVELVAELVARGAVVELERAGWRLVVRPAGRGVGG